MFMFTELRDSNGKRFKIGNKIYLVWHKRTFVVQMFSGRYDALYTGDDRRCEIYPVNNDAAFNGITRFLADVAGWTRKLVEETGDVIVCEFRKKNCERSLPQKPRAKKNGGRRR
jgi:hypothetical protein